MKVLNLKSSFDLDEALEHVNSLACRLWRFWRKRQYVFDFEDLRQAGLLGILAAQRGFDPTREISLARYGRKAAHVEMIRLIGSSSMLSGTEVDNGLEFIRPRPLPIELAARKRNKPRKSPDVSVHLSVLTDKQRDIMCRILGINSPAMSYREIARLKGVSYGTVSNTYRQSLARMRQAVDSSEQR